jgi:hypothetical protein
VGMLHLTLYAKPVESPPGFGFNELDPDPALCFGPQQCVLYFLNSKLIRATRSAYFNSGQEKHMKPDRVGESSHLVRNKCYQKAVIYCNTITRNKIKLKEQSFI